MAVKALNNTAGLNRLILTLLIFRAYLRINKDLEPSLDITAQAAAVQKAIKLLHAVRAKININCAINT
jgi:hypothetical protein